MDFHEQAWLQFVSCIQFVSYNMQNLAFQRRFHLLQYEGGLYICLFNYKNLKKGKEREKKNKRQRKKEQDKRVNK